MNAFSACFMTGALLLCIFGWTTFFFNQSSNCDVKGVSGIDYSDISSIDKKYIHIENSNNTVNSESSGSSLENLDEPSGEKNAIEGNDAENKINNNNENKTKKDKNNDAPGSSAGGSLGSNSGAGSGGGNSTSEQNKRWVPEKTQVIHHPAETTKVKHCQVTCMCGDVFTGNNVPAAVAAWQNHRPNP